MTEESKEQQDKGQEKAFCDPPWYKRQDVLVLLGGQLIFGMIAGVIFGLGAWRGWDAPSGYTHNQTLNSQLRFLPEPSDPDPYPHVKGRLGTKAASRWYYWKLKPWEVTVWTQTFVWLCYLVHQVALWIVIYLAQLHKATTTEPKYLTTLNRYNWISLVINVFFHILHVVQTHTTYDGLAQELTVATPQSSAITLFIWVMVLEYSERGLIFYWPTAKDTGKWNHVLRLNLKPVYLVRKYHAYMFAWVSVHTVWYHPMENTYGHVLGFYHTWLILLQGSLMYTKIHQNRWLRFFQEVMVGIHGGTVALQTGGPDLNGTKLWPLFTFGALFMLVFTWIFILDIWAKIPKWTRVIPVIIFLALAVGVYSIIPDAQGCTFIRLQEVLIFPLIFYIGFTIAYIVLYLFIMVDEKVHGTGLAQAEVSTTKKVLYMTAFMVVYAIMVAVSFIIYVCDLQTSVTISSTILIIAYILGSAAAMLFTKHIIPRRSIKAKTKPGRFSSTQKGTEPVVEAIRIEDKDEHPSVSVLSVDNGQCIGKTVPNEDQVKDEPNINDAHESNISNASNGESEGTLGEQIPNASK